MTRRGQGLVLVLALVFFNPVVVGLGFGILPCYVLPTIGEIRWCGYKSAPPYFGEQAATGAALSVVVLICLVVRWLRRPPTPPES